MNKLNIGLDLSINSTGLVVRNGEKTKFYCIVDKIKRRKKYVLEKNPIITLIEYQKLKLKDYPIYNDKEHAKTQNVISVFNSIKDIINTYENIECVYIEGIAFNSTNTNSLVELGSLNFLCRDFFIKKGIKYHIVSPNENKKNACGDGAANKEKMILTFKQFHPEIIEMQSYCKIDDIADAFFLSMTSEFSN